MPHNSLHRIKRQKYVPYLRFMPFSRNYFCFLVLIFVLEQAKYALLLATVQDGSICSACADWPRARALNTPAGLFLHTGNAGISHRTSSDTRENFSRTQRLHEHGTAGALRAQRNTRPCKARREKQLTQQRTTPALSCSSTPRAPRRGYVCPPCPF